MLVDSHCHLDLPELAKDLPQRLALMHANDVGCALCIGVNLEDLPRILALAEEPRPPGVVKMHGGGGYYRLRVGDYRVVYAIEDDVLLVLVVRIGHRREVYR